MPELTVKIAFGARLSAANEELELSIAEMSLALALDHKLASRTPISTTTVAPETATSGKSVTRRGYLVLYEPDAADDDEPSASPS